MKFHFDRKIILYIIPLLISILAFTAGCGQGAEAGLADASDEASLEHVQQIAASPTVKETAKWTVLIYMAADNDLETTAWQDINKMEQIGSTDDVNIVVQWDNGGKYGAKGCRRYYITKNPDDKVGKISSPVMTDLSEVNSADPTHLVDFVEWSMKKYPAEKYALILWNHGAGWRAPTREERSKVKGICFDEKSGLSMSVEQLHSAFVEINSKYGKKLEFIGMDACLMGMTEVAYNMKDVGNYLTFSESSVYGFPYHYILGDLTADPSVDGRRLSEIVVERFRQYWNEMGEEYFTTISTVDLSQVENLTLSIDNFAGLIKDRLDEEKTNLAIAMEETEGIDKIFTDFKDLNLFLNKLEEKTTDQEVESRIHDLQNAIKNTVIYEAHGEQFSPGTAGLTIWLPDREKFEKYNSEYLNLPFSHFTRWDEILEDVLE